MELPPAKTKRAHTVPEFYLQGFITAGTQRFWVYDKLKGSVREDIPRNITVERYFYAYDRSDGRKVEPLERYFAEELENEAAPILEVWRKPKALPSHDQIEMMAVFLAYMHLRTRRALENLTLLALADLAVWLERAQNNPIRREAVLSSWQQNLGDPSMTFEELQRFAEEPASFQRSERFRQAAMNLALEVNVPAFQPVPAETVRGQLLMMNWSLLEAPTGAFYITSDSPLTVWSDDDEDVIPGLGGFGSQSANVALPISPEVAIVLGRQHSPVRPRIRASHKIVNTINYFTARLAVRDVISAYKSGTVKRLVAGCGNQEPNFERLTEVVRQVSRQDGYVGPE